MSRTKRKASALDELNSGRVKSLQNYKDARDKSGEELWADDFEAQGDKILLDGEAARTRLGDFEDDTEEILPLKLRQRQHDDDDQEESEVSEQEPPAKKPRHRQTGHEPLPTTKTGRFSRPDPTEQDRLDRISDSEDSSDESVDEGDRVESWGKQYHVSRREMEAGPSTRKPSKKGKHADEDDGVDELREALTIQYTQKSQLAPEDFGELSDATESEPEDADADAPVEQPTQVFENREQAIAHLLSTRPYLLSLLTDYAALTELLPDIKKRVAAHMLTPGMHPASKGLASFQLDLVEAYLTVCAFYLSLVARGLANSDLSEEALLRLTTLREQIQNLEEAGISLDNVEEEEAQSDADGNPTKEELLQMLVDQNDLIKRMQAEGVADDSEPESELEDSAGSDGDFDPEAEFDDGVAVEIKKQPKAAGPKKERKPRHSAVQKRQKAALTPAKPSKPSTKAEKLGDDFLEAASLSRSDRDDKKAKKHSLRFHTSQISSKEKKRGQATQVRMAGGDDDVPFVSKEAQRREAQRKEAAQVAKELAAEAGKATSKAAETSVPEELAGASGYYDLVKSAKSEEREAKKQAYDEQLLANRAALNQVTETDGPRSVSYAILRNKGLTPKRNKLNRNPRAKKRARYEAAKKKIGSMKSVYKADAAAQGRQAYQGEKSGIGMKTVKSRKL